MDDGDNFNYNFFNSKFLSKSKEKNIYIEKHIYHKSALWSLPHHKKNIQ
jgi:hypothetical protein